MVLSSTYLLKFIISCFNSFTLFSFGFFCRKQISDITLVKDFFNFIIIKSPITFLKVRVSDVCLFFSFFSSPYYCQNWRILSKKVGGVFNFYSRVKKRTFWQRIYPECFALKHFKIKCFKVKSLTFFKTLPSCHFKRYKSFLWTHPQNENSITGITIRM